MIRKNFKDTPFGSLTSITAFRWPRHGKGGVAGQPDYLARNRACVTSDP